MTDLEEEISRHEHARYLASQVSIVDIMECELPDDLRQELLCWKLFDVTPLGTA